MWPFKRKPRPGPKRPPPTEDWSKSADWRVGDLAVCISDQWPILAEFNPKKDDVLRVSRVAPTISWDGSVHFIGLGFEGKPSGCLWGNVCFRKAQQDREPAETRFARLIKRPVGKPVKLIPLPALEPAHG